MARGGISCCYFNVKLVEETEVRLLAQAKVAFHQDHPLRN